MDLTLMQLKIVLPTKIFMELDEIRCVVVETPAGEFGLLPRRLDCASLVVPGILTYASATGDVAFVAHDEGVMIKHSQLVLISVRRAFHGSNLALVHEQFKARFEEKSEAELDQEPLQTRLESDFLQNFAQFRHI